MRLTVPVLRTWRPESLPRAAADLDATGTLLDDLERSIQRAVGAMVWEGAAADSARAAAQDLVLGLRELRESYSMQAEVVRRAASGIELAQELLSDAQRLASAHGLVLLPDGEVTPPRAVLSATDLPPTKACASRTSWMPRKTLRQGRGRWRAKP